MASSVESRTYTDGTTATGVSPLPASSPAQQGELVALLREYGDFMCSAGYLNRQDGEVVASTSDDHIQRILSVVAPPHRGYVLFGAGAYLLTICKGDERGPELVAHIATDEEKNGRTIGDLGEVVPGKEIPLERVAVRLQFASEAGLAALEQQLRMLRDEHFPAPHQNAALPA